MPPKKKRLSTTSAESTSPPHESPPETQFVPLDDDDENMWEAEAILDEDVVRKEYYLKWVGVDPKNNQPWENSWEPKNGVTQSLIDEWKEKKKRDPMLIGKFSREETERKEAAVAAKAAQAAKARKAKAEQARKRKRTADSSRSTESPKKARKAAGRPVSVVSDASSAMTRDTSRAPKRTAPATRTASPRKQKTAATGSSTHVRKAARIQDTSFEVVDVADSEEDQDDGFHPPSSPPRAEGSRHSTRDPRSRSFEPGATARATRSTSTTAPKLTGRKGLAAPSQSAVVPRQVTPDLHDADATRHDSPGPAIHAQSSDETHADVDRPSKPTPQTNGPSATPRAELAERSRTLLEGASSPRLVATRRPRVEPVPQPAPSLFRQGEPETQTTDTDKSIPISQADPIVDFSSPSHAESSSAARRRAQRPGVSDTMTIAPLQPTPSAKLVPKMIDGEVWMTSPDSDEEEAAAAEGELAEPATKSEIGIAEGSSPRANLRPLAAFADLASASREKDGKIEQLEVIIADLQKQLEQIARPPAASAPTIDLDTRLLEEKDTVIQQLRAELAETQAKAVPTVPPSAVDLALFAAKDAKIAELESTVATLSSSLIAAEKAVSEPSAELQNLMEGNKFLVVQVDEATSRFEQAEKELAAARAQIAELSKSKAAVDTAAVDSLQAELAAAQAEKDALARKAKNLSDENDFFRQQYQQASNSAVESVRQARELEDEVEKLRSQLKLGLKQRNMHYEAIHAKREAEAVKLRATNTILLEQSRRTDDAIRRKAALYDKYRTENDQLRAHESAWQDRYAALQERNEELADQVAALRGKQMGVFGDDDEGESDYTEGDAEDDITDDERAAGSGSRGTIGGFTSSQLSEAGGDNPFRSLPAAVLLRGQADEEQVAEGEVESLVDGEALRCHWRNDQAQCDLAFDRIEDLAHHGRAHAYEHAVKVEV